jgi:outer membrane receptor protein involved in Fe transport
MNFGGEYWRLSTFAGTANGARGSFDFNGQFTSRTPGRGYGQRRGRPAARFDEFASLTTPQVATFLVDYYGGYFNDSWRISPKLTINLGLRYELQTRQREEA